MIHLNVADFAVAVEQLIDRRLRDRPVIVAPPGLARTVVYDMSEEAYRAGIRKGMGAERARALCRDATWLPPHPDCYERAMRALLKHALPYTPLIECADENGHLFLDVTGCGRLFGPPVDIAWRIRRAVQADLGLLPIWTVAVNKLVAKAASRLVKPWGEQSVAPGSEEAFLSPLPLPLLPGIERPELLRLRDFHLHYAGDLVALGLDRLEILLGHPTPARTLLGIARGQDDSPVRSLQEQRPVVLGEHLFGEDTNDRRQVEGALYALSESLGRELRRRQLALRRVGLRLDYNDGTRLTRSAAADPATACDFRIFELARQALDRAWTRRVRIRHLRLTGDRLIFPPVQLPLFPDEFEQQQQAAGLMRALDRIRTRFGEGAIRVGRCLTLT